MSSNSNGVATAPASNCTPVISKVPVAFTGKLKQTLVFILIGTIIIQLFNVLRIALLCMAIFHFPEYEHILHGVIFPLFIYGIVFLLWVIWVNKYSSYATTSIKK
jgi:exosortase family protein XrtF